MSIAVAVENLGIEFIKKVKENEPVAKEKVLKQIASDTDEYVPYKTGKLVKSVEVRPNSSEIVYKEGYASYAFDPVAKSGKPKQYSVETHELAQGHPLQAAYKEHNKEWAELFAKELLNGVK